MSAVDDLEQLPIFAGVAHDQVERLARFAEEIDVPSGTALTHEGRYEGQVFLVISGRLAIEREGRTVDTIGPGDVLGEIAAIDGGPRTATGRALEDCRVVAVTARQFNDALDAAPELQTAVMAQMEARLSRMDAESGA